MEFLLWGALNTVVYILVLLAVFYKYFCLIYFTLGDRGSTVVKVLCYKSDGRWFDPRWRQWIFH
jgi:hypothetical protein